MHEVAADLFLESADRGRDRGRHLPGEDPLQEWGRILDVGAHRRIEEQHLLV